MPSSAKITVNTITNKGMKKKKKDCRTMPFGFESVQESCEIVTKMPFLCLKIKITN
jgi:hypothetical protein